MCGREVLPLHAATKKWETSVKQKIDDKKISIINAVKISGRYLSTYIYLKFSFAILPIVTAEVPGLGEYFDVKYSRYVAMLPNVIIFEKILDRNECKKRCQYLVHNEGIAIRTTYTIPALISVVILVIWTYLVTVHEPSYAILLLIFPFLLLYIIYGATNTFLYLLLSEEKIRKNG